MFKFKSKKEQTPTNPAPEGSSLRSRLKRSRAQWGDRLRGLFGGTKIDDEVFEELETLLLTADVGTSTTMKIMEQLQAEMKRAKLSDGAQLRQALDAILTDLLSVCEVPLASEFSHKPFVIMMVGVNGAGKTTTIGKLALRFKEEGKSVVLAAGDTFRAAAVEQLKTWGERNEVPVIAQQSGADSASVAFDALQSAQARGADVLIVDSAGRLHTQSNLMEELKKIKRVMAKLDPGAPHEIMLVIDGGMGQNALSQAKEFHEAMSLTGITITKLDGTARGGILFAIAQEIGVPIRFIGVGEAATDLRPFETAAFVSALMDDGETAEQ